MNSQLLLEKIVALPASSTVIGALTSGLLGLAVTATDFVKEGNGGLVVGLCAVLGALLANLPKIMRERSTARLSESEFVASTTRGLIETLMKSASDNERILAMERELRHRIQGAYQTSVFHIAYLEGIMEDHAVKNYPQFTRLDVEKLMSDYDGEVVRIKNAREQSNA